MAGNREVEKSAGRVRLAAEREHSARDGARSQRRAADRESAAASHVLLRRELAKGRPPAQPPAKRG
jgi:hypothetical protein